MKSHTITYAIAGLALAVLVFQYLAKPKPDTKAIAQMAQYRNENRWWLGKYPPDFELPFLDHGMFSLSSVIGKKVVILNFFATWCEPCREEIPELNTFYRKHRDVLAMIGVNNDEKTNVVKKFVFREGVAFPVVIDNGELKRKFNIGSFPTTIMIGIDGRIIKFQPGMIANAEVIFEADMNAQRKLLAAGQGISSEKFLKQPRLAPPWETRLTNESAHAAAEAKIELKGKALEFARTTYCPSCGSDLTKCSCSFCENVKKRLQTIDFAGRTDEQVVRELYMTPHKK